ncbi:serine hydrolase domain-containing protein [Pseudoroseicyclus sp. H15]
MRSLPLIAASLATCLTAFPAHAQESIPERVEAAWRGWAEEGGTEVSTLAVMQNGELVGEYAMGTEPDAAMPLASLTKAITAGCADAVPGLTADTKVGDLLGAGGPAAEARLGDLMTHTAGIWPDSTQGNAAVNFSDTPMIQEVAAVALGRDPQQGTPGTYAYNNENYALIGAMIEEATGESYAEACDAALFQPLGLETPVLDGPWAAHGSWGGWSMSAADFARFVRAEFGPEGRVGADPAAWDIAELGGGLGTLAGVLSADVEGRRFYWSFGQLCWNGAGDGSYFASYGGEWVVVVMHGDCIMDDARLQALDAVLFGAVFQ